MMLNRIKHESSTEPLLWALEFRCLSRDVADQVGVTPQYISQVIHRVRRDARIEKALRREWMRRRRMLDSESAA